MRLNANKQLAVKKRLAAIVFSKSGVLVCRKLQNAIEDLDLYLKAEMCTLERDLVIGKPFKSFVGEIFNKYDGLIFVMSTGIVVREIAPFLKSKKTDPAVVVIDDHGQYVISLLSGHLGGANELARTLSEILEAKPVITTSTDLHQVPAFDLIAKEYNMKIERLHDLKFISGALIDGEKVGLYTDLSYPLNVSILVEERNNLDEFLNLEISEIKKLFSSWKGVVLITHRLISKEVLEKWALPTLILRPKNLVVGMGLKRGKTKAELEEALLKACKTADVSPDSISKITTIDIKQDEVGLHKLCDAYNLSLQIFSTEEVKAVEDKFSISEFVKKTIGVGGVAEPTVFLGTEKGEWVLRRQKLDGVTVAIMREI
ncbi:MAG: cobalt-precorrin 5A hydrolase [Halanaerobiales bacterium]|nr:cobalt-precorrin 5A hydrolase [Halanaerobiales bacterium]